MSNHWKFKSFCLQLCVSIYFKDLWTTTLSLHVHTFTLLLPISVPRFRSSKYNFVISLSSVELLLFLLLMFHLSLRKQKPCFVNSAFYVLHFKSFLFMLSSFTFGFLQLICISTSFLNRFFVTYNIFNFEASS